MSAILRLTSLFLAIVVCASCAHTQVKLIPDREWVEDLTLGRFIADLTYAAENRDANFILSILSENVIGSISEVEFGTEYFNEIWNVESRMSHFWDCLLSIIKMGGANYDRSPTDVVFPYAFDTDLRGHDIDEFDVLVVTSELVDVRFGASTSEKLAGQLNYEVVIADWAKSVLKNEGHENECNPYEWYHIKTIDGRLQGFIHSDFVYSPVMPRMFIAKEGGQWRITAFVAGD